ncbi:MAG: sigma-70 family RNA polymerase sigma factor [Ruminococcaceae bacterium]|nr:sigma-70 family RNA polymerase sigma factor [Oscillospiraceae bacterium]
MEDNQIVDLYWERDERAISESDTKYGAFCARISMNILDNAQDAEECVNDTYLRAWNAIPPDRPIKLGAFLGKITRNLSLDRYKAKKAAKRGNSLFQVSLDELNECIPSGSTGFGSGFDDESEARRIGDCINRFLRKQSAEVRNVFICRYFYSDSIGEISRRFGITESKIKSMLHRARGKLKKFLESEGIRL